jgi:phosphoglycolate phosphatase
VKSLRAVVFDLDGTLIDSVPDIAAALNGCLLGVGRSPLTEAEVMALVGGGARELVARALGTSFTEVDVDGVFGEFLARYEAEPVRRTRLYPGARDLLDHLNHIGLPLAICTNKPIGLTRLILDRLEISAYFRAVWGGQAGRPLKPDPECLRTLCGELGTTPVETLMVGDSHVDVDAARTAGCLSIVVAHGYEQRPRDSLGADVVVAGLAEAGREIACRLGHDQVSAAPARVPS